MRENEQKNKQKDKNIEVGIMLSSIIVVLVFMVFMIVYPKETIEIISSFFNKLIQYATPLLEVVFFVTFIFAIYLMLGKPGEIRLGEEKPEYSTFSYISMMLLASLASAALYWSFTEWAYYYKAPGLGIEPYSTEALETSLGYQFFHWGMTNQAVYTVMGVAIAYAVYVKKSHSFQISAVCSLMVKNTSANTGKIKILGKLIDFLIVFGILGGLGSTLGLAVPLAVGGLQKLWGVNDSHLLEIGIIAVITLVYVIMTILGTQRGMKVVSNSASILTIILLLFILLCGPTSFILKNIVNSFGIMLHNLVPMSLFTDPVSDTGFVEQWTVYFEAFYLNYVAMMGIFIAKISKGRTIREVAVATLLGISAGGWLLFGINGSFSINAYLEGNNIIDVINSGMGEKAIYEIMELLPLGTTVLPLMILLLIIGFVAPSMDSASLALSETVTKSGSPKLSIRLFWCIMLAVIPMCIILTDTSFDAIKQISIIISVPFCLILIFIEIGLIRWLKKDRSNS